MADEEIIIKYTVESQEALREVIKIRDGVREALVGLSSLAKESVADIEEVAKGLKKAFAKQTMAAVDPMDKESLSKARKAINEYNASINRAVQIWKKTEADKLSIAKQTEAKITAEEKKQQDIRIKQEQEAAQQQIAISKAQIKDELTYARSASKAREDVASESYKNEQGQLNLQNKIKKDNVMQEIAIKKAQLKEAADLEKQFYALLKQQRDMDVALNRKYGDDVYKARKEGFDKMTAEEKRAWLASEKQVLETDKKVLAIEKNHQQQRTKEVQRETKNREAAYKREAKEVQKSMDDQKKSSNFLTKAFDSLGTTTKAVFGAAFGVTAVSAIRDVMRAIDDLINKALEYNRSETALIMALREMKRLGTEVSMSEVIDEITRLQESYTMFSKVDIEAGFGKAAMRLARLGFTVKDLGKVIESSLIMKMTDTTERFDDASQAADVLATYLASNFGQGVESAGIIAGRAAGKLIMYEKGLQADINTLDPYTAALSRLDFVNRQLLGSTEDVGIFTESAAGKIATSSAKVIDSQAQIGKQLVPLKISWEKFIAGLWSGFISFYSGLELLLGKLIIIVGHFIEMTVQNFYTYKDLLSDPKKFLVFDFSAYIKSQFDALSKELEDYENDVLEQYTSGLDDLEKRGNKALSEVELGQPLLNVDDLQSQENITKAVEDIKKIFEDYNADIAEADREFLQDMGGENADQLDAIVGTWSNFFSDRNNLSVQASQDLLAQQEGSLGDLGTIVEDGLSQALDIWSDYFNTLDDIARDSAQEVLDAQIELQQDIEDTNREYQQSVQDAERKYREEELKAERDYQEEMRRLRDDFLFDLEDALRERDALQVLRLMRGYERDKEELANQAEQERQERLDNYRQELEDLRIQRDRKLQELQIEFQRRLEEIQIQAEREREEATRKRDQELSDLQADLEAKRIERQKAYEQEVLDLDAKYKALIQTTIDNLVQQGIITADLAADVTAALAAEFGQGGKVEGIYKYLISIINASVASAIAAIQQLMAYQQSIGSIYGAGDTYNLSPNSGINAMATGGTMYANQPTTALFGEAGPEIAQFIPISRLNTNDISPVSSSAAQALQGGGNGKVKVEVWLSGGLEGKIIDSTMNQLASIFEGRP